MNSSRVLKGYAGTNPRRGISAWHICFHSNVIIPFGDINEIRRSQYAVINPAVDMVFLLCEVQMVRRVRYMFASFWNRNHAIRILQRAAKNYHSMEEAEKKDVFPRTAEQILDMLLNDGSNFTSEYRSARKDTNLNIGQWHSADEYDGQVFETVQQAHDVPFGSYFEMAYGDYICIDVKVGKFLPHS
ncbi:hypothetical protein L1887_08634 [Cichorium endivia]|nr:hypothetical protein L1887_08634 [Cichorium endivia]